MALPNIFSQTTTDELLQRIEKLNKDSTAQWGTMNVGQMLAHCNVTYEMVYEDFHAKPNFFLKTILKTFVKPKVISEAPYEQNGRTAPQFVITGEKEFEKEKKRLIHYLEQTVALGESNFDGKESHSFGALNKQEWSNMFYKHLDHHLKQFGV